jgi:hypothetical protein
MATAAWKSLDAVARAVYVHIASRYAGPGSNNGRIPYSVREAAAELHIGKSTAARALKMLGDRGFLVAEQHGGFNCKIRHSTEWRLTEFPSDVSGELATKDFTRWSAQKQNTVLQGNRTVSRAGPNSTHNGTAIDVNALKGTRGGTVDATSAAASVRITGHL